MVGPHPEINGAGNKVNEVSPYFTRREFLGADSPIDVQVPHFLREQGIPTLRRWWAVVRPRLRLIFAIVFASVLLTGVAVLLMTPTYTAESTVLIERQAPQVLDMRALTAEQAGSDEHDYYETQYKIFESRGLATQVIRELNLEANPLLSAKKDGFISELAHGATNSFGNLLALAAGSMPAPRTPEKVDPDSGAVENYLSRLEIRPQLGTRLVILGFRTPDPKLSAEIANAHVQAFVHRGMEIHAQASEDARGFLEKKLVDLRARVEKSEAALNSYRRDRGIVTFELQDKGKILMERLTELNTEFTKAESERIALEAQVELLDKGRIASLSAVINNPLIQKLKTEVAALSADYAEKANRFTPDYHPLADLGAKLNEARNRLEAETQRMLEGVQSEYKAAGGRERRLNNEIDNVKQQALALNDASLQDAVLAREVDTNRELYKSVLERMKELGVAAGVPGSNVSIVDVAVPPRFPSSPRIFLSLLASAMLSPIAAIALVFLLDHLDDRIKDPEEAQSLLQAPSLGMVPDFTKVPAIAYGARETVAAVQEKDLTPAPASLHSKEMVTEASRFSVAAEVYRSIRTAILYARAGGPPKTILITSGSSGEGKTVTAVNVAIAFAHIGEKILLVDTDMRRSRCHEVFGMSNHLGLADVLAGRRQLEEVIKPTAVEGLYLLSAGTSPPNPSELLGSNKMREVLEKLSQDYAHVVLDSAPAMPVSDTIILSTMTDGVVVVVGSDTSRYFARTACMRLRGVGAKLIGIVMNQVDLRGPAYYSYAGYQAYGYGRRDKAA